jgi:uridine kinase
MVVGAEEVLARVAALRPVRSFGFVGIGGHGAAGKTTLARALPAEATIGTDEFWDGEGFDLTRLRREVFDPLLAGEAARFRSYDWAAQAPRASRIVEPRGLIVVEGVCALHRLFRGDYDLRVWVDAPRRLRLARGIARDGEAARRRWEEVWMPSEDRYVAEDDPVACADVIVDGVGGPR